MSSPRYHTTHQVAQLLGVSLPTVVNWVDRGLLEAHRTPGGHRRISYGSLVRFARTNNYPLEEKGQAEETDRRQVLVVDDDPDSSEMVGEYLLLKGEIQTALAEDEAEAGFMLAKFQPQVILLGLQMGGMDSLALGRRLQELAAPQKVQILAWSDFASPDLEERAREAGFVDFLAKPIQLDDILRAIQVHLVD